MAEENLSDIIKRKQDRIESLEKKNKLLYNLLYQAKQELNDVKERVRKQADNPSQILQDTPSSEP